MSKSLSPLSSLSSVSSESSVSSSSESSRYSSSDWASQSSSEPSSESSYHPTITDYETSSTYSPEPEIRSHTAAPMTQAQLDTLRNRFEYCSKMPTKKIREIWADQIGLPGQEQKIRNKYRSESNKGGEKAEGLSEEDLMGASILAGIMCSAKKYDDASQD